MTKKIVFIKFGGGLITDKSTSFKINEEVIDGLIFQIKHIIQSRQDLGFIIGNGAGSFGHFYAEKYKVNDNYTNFSSEGLTLIHHSVLTLNKIIIDKMINNKINCFTLHPSSFIFSSNKKLKKIFIEPMIGLLNQNIIPFVYGDMVIDENLGSVVYSTERIFYEIIKRLYKRFKIDEIIHCVNVDGVLDRDKKNIEKINKKNFAQIKKMIYKPEGYDVSGGMMHKISESLKIAQNYKIKTLIFNGYKNNNLLRYFSGEKVIGTFVE
ncbi:MAG: amino acid kinase [Patescibacteria group bacterium]|nr:MAG: amino acid kinase [Patescibacteria group bacterium]